MTTLVIGADSGIGKAFADRCLGRDPILTAGITGETGYHLDLGRSDVEVQYANIFEEVHPNKIVYCSGVNYLNWLRDTSLSDVRRIMNVNVIGFIELMAQVDSIMDDDGDYKPKVVAIASDAGYRPLRTSIAYCSSKAALHMAVKVAARELGPKGARINSISPGMIDGTEMSDKMDSIIPNLRNWTKDEMLAYEKSQEVVPGRVQVAEVLDAIEWLLYGAPHHLNGEDIKINGGR